MEEHYQILEELEKRKLFDVELRYNTNFSNLNFKDKSILQIWKQFKKVHVRASIDAAFKLGEDIRDGLHWEEFINNRQEMLTVCPEVFFEITPTVSSLNISNLPELHQELVNQQLIDIDSIYLNFLERPQEFNVQQLPIAQKQEIQEILKQHIKWLIANEAKTKVITDFDNLISYMKIN